ncbi:MAG: cytochrome [Rhodobacteraceae bacterium]|nr:cytochrome [Paracoccaceae bacterium]
MSLSNSPSSYGAVAKTFHWLTALLIFTVFPLGMIAENLAHQIQSPGFDGNQDVISRATLLFSLHKTLGVTVFFVALLRILWAMTQAKPGLLNAENKPEALAAETVHWLLYGSLVLVPLTGWIHHAATTGFAPIWWPFGQTLPFVPKSEPVSELFAALHWIMVIVLGGSLFLHVAGALKHHIVDRDHTLRRMLPGRSDAPQPPAQHASLLPAGIAVVVWAGALGAGSMTGMFSASHGASQEQASTGEVHTSAQSGQQAETTDGTSDSGWIVQDGTLGVQVVQMGSIVTGSFGSWTAEIQFEEPDAPGPAGSVSVSIDIASLTLGSVTAQAMGADYFDSAQFPTALFQAEIVKTETAYEARGTLQIRDKTLPLTLPFSLELDGETAKMAGEVALNRLDYEIGKGVTDEGSLAFEVLVPVALTATRQN